MNHRTVLVATAALLLLPLCVRAEVDVELAAKAKVKGSISPDGDTDTFHFEASRDATVALTVKAKKGLDPSVTITGPGAVAVPLSGATKFVDQRTKVLVKGLVLPSHGDYTLVVAGTGSGDYTLKLNVVPKKVVEFDLTLAGLESAQVAAAAPDGADIVFTARAAKGSAVVPEFEEALKASSATLTLDDVSGPGDFEVTVRNAAGDGGDVSVVAKIKPAKAKTQKVDVRSKTLSKQGGGETAVGATVGEGGGAVAVGDGDLAGAGVDIPPGALAGDVLVSVRSTSNVDVPGGGNLGAGPSVEFGPDGIQFSQPVGVTIPYDPNAIPEGQSAGGVLQVVQEESDGSQTTLDPSDVDTDAGTVTVQTSGFSRFRAFVPRGRPRLSGGEFWFVDLQFQFDPDPQDGGDSRGRSVAMGVGAVDLGDQGEVDGSSVSARDTRFDFGHDLSPTAFVQSSPDPFSTNNFTWSYGPDGQTVRIDDGDGPDESFFVSEDGRFLSGAVTADPGDLTASLALLGRRPSRQVTLSDLAGDYWLGVFNFNVDATPDGNLEIETGRNFASMTVASDGGVRLTGDGLFKGWFGRIESERDRFSVPATIGVDTTPGPLQGSARLSIDEDDETIRLLPVAGGDVMFGLPDDTTWTPLLIIVVRKSTNASTATPAGERSNTGILLDDIVTYDVLDQFSANVTLPDIRVSNITERVSLAADGTANPFDVTEVQLFRDPGVSTGVRRMDVSDGSDSARLTVDRSGKLGSRDRSDPLLGATSPDGVFLFAMVGITSPEEFGFDVSLRLPPAIVSTAK